MKELLEKYIGRKCVVTGASGSIIGTITSLTENSLELNLEKKNKLNAIFNINHIYNVTILNDK